MRKKTKRAGLLVLIFAMLATLLPAGLAGANSSVDVPFIKGVSKYASNSQGDPLIWGYTQENTNVLIYIDGSYAGHAQVEPGTNGSPNSFKFYSRRGVEPGMHEIMAVAQNRTSLVLSPPSSNFEFVVPEPVKVPAPTIAEPRQGGIEQQTRPLITGLTVSGTRVNVFVDGVYYGKTDYVYDDSGTANFAYRLPQDLSYGQHEIELVTEDQSGRKAERTAKSGFEIEWPLPAPMIVKNNVHDQRVSLAGLVKNGLKVRVYLDFEIVETLKPGNHPSGTHNFAVDIEGLTKGEHVVYTTSIDERGKESRWSQPIHFLAASSSSSSEKTEKEESEPKITDQAAAEGVESDDREANNEEPVVKGEDNVGEQGEQGSRDGGEEGAEEDTGGVGSDLDNEPVVGTSSIDKNTGEQTGLVNENQESQSRMGWNLVIFLIFMIAVIGWIFWVNRELIKEKRQQESGGSTDDDKKKE